MLFDLSSSSSSSSNSSSSSLNAYGVAAAAAAIGFPGPGFIAPAALPAAALPVALSLGSFPPGGGGELPLMPPMPPMPAGYVNVLGTKIGKKKLEFAKDLVVQQIDAFLNMAHNQSLRCERALFQHFAVHLMERSQSLPDVQADTSPMELVSRKLSAAEFAEVWYARSLGTVVDGDGKLNEKMWTAIPAGNSKERNLRIDARRFMVLFEHVAMPDEVQLLRCKDSADLPRDTSDKATRAVSVIGTVVRIVERINTQYLPRYEYRDERLKEKDLTVAALFIRWQKIGCHLHDRADWMIPSSHPGVVLPHPHLQPPTGYEMIPKMGAADFMMAWYVRMTSVSHSSLFIQSSDSSFFDPGVSFGL